uniref:F-box domain-containing protein n=1 Tax=Trichogramma kaykai TaxID=54128 RepID=A0ABD2XAU6_9HYME
MLFLSLSLMSLNAEIVGELLGHPTGPRQVEARDRHGNTALHELLGTPRLGRLHHYGLAMLLARGGRVNAANLNGSTALHQVVKITRFNRESGLPEQEDCSSGMVAYLLSLGADPAALDARLTSPMQLACNRLNFWAMDSLMQAGVVEDWADFQLDLATMKNRPYLDFCFNVLDLMEVAQVRGHTWDERQESRVLEALLSPERFEAGYRERMSSVLQLGSEREIRAYFEARDREIQELGDRDPPTRSYLTGLVLQAIHVPIGLHGFGLRMPRRVYRYLVELFNRLQSGPDRVEFLRDDIAALNTEMEYTKNVPIGDGRRLNELLGLAPEEGIEPRHIRWLDHPCAQEVLRKRIFYTMYPKSGGYIEAHVAKCLVKRFAARLGARLVGLLAPYRRLPDLVCREIVAHLAPEDILNVARATQQFL